MDISSTDRDPAGLLPLTPAVFHMMLALARGSVHGYAMMQAAEQLSGGRFQLGPGTLYRSLQKMLVDNLIDELAVQGPSQADERRRYYRLTPFGRRVAVAEAQRLDALVRAARNEGLLKNPRTKGAYRATRR